MKLKINSLHLKQIGLLILLFIPICAFLNRYGYGAVFFGISQKMYQRENVTITLPWGWYNGRLDNRNPLVFLTYDQNTNVDFEYYDKEASDNDKYENVIVKLVNNGARCYISHINSNETYLFEKQLENTFAILAYIPSARLEIFYESEDKKPAKDWETNHYKRIKRILSNIEIDKNDNKLYYDIDESLKKTIYSKCEELR